MVTCCHLSVAVASLSCLATPTQLGAEGLGQLLLPAWREALNTPSSHHSPLMASSRNTVSNTPARNLDEINFSHLARIFELVELVCNGTYKHQLFFYSEEKEVGHERENNIEEPRSLEKKDGEEVLQASKQRFLCKP